MKPLVQVGRYLVFEEIASGGMASVHFGRLVADTGFTRTVAIKRLHPHIAGDPSFVATLFDEARLASRIRHPNVVQTLDLVQEGNEVLVVMDYIEGASLSRLSRTALRAGTVTPLPVVSAIIGDLLLGLHAAHEARDDRGEALNIVHRDVSPQNLLVGIDGISRIVDFGVAKATSRSQTTSEGQLKGKLAYMSPEQLRLEPSDRRADVFAAGVVAWELFTRRRLFLADSPAQIMASVLAGKVQAPSAHVPELPLELDAIVVRALKQDPDERYSNTLEMAEELSAVVPRASSTEVTKWVESVAGDQLRDRADRLGRIEASSSTDSSGHATASREVDDEPTATDLSATTPLPKRRRRGAAFLALLVVSLIGAGVLIGRALSRPKLSPASGVASISADATRDLESPSPQRSDIAAPAASTPAPAVSAPSPMGSEQPIGQTPATKPRHTPKRGPRAPGTASPKSERPGCSPPYYFDKFGQKRFKEECYP